MMGLLGIYSKAEVARAYWNGYSAGKLAGKKKYADRAGRRASHIWSLWCRSNLRAGRKPPLLCPSDIIDEVRADLARERPGL